MTATVTILNPGGVEAIGRVTWRHAIGMIYRGVARATGVELINGRLQGDVHLIDAVELVKYVYAKWRYERTGRLAPSTANVLRRDRHKCAYCGRTATTRDHVTPVCQGGATSWSNLVAACGDCNSRKDGRTPQQAGMKLRISPFVPAFHDLYPSSG